MVVDIFSFFNELDLLEIRLSILDPYVDKFVIVEATETFSGVPKPLYFQENKERFKKWEHKIVHYVVDDYPHDAELLKMAQQSPNTGAGEHWWVREFYQKEAIKRALVGLDDEDICFVSDLDEIWSPDIKITGDAVYKPKQLPYLYYFNQRTDEDWMGWTGTIATKYKNIKNACLNHLRTDSMTDYVVIENGGWHFNAIGGKQQKKEAFKHPEYDFDWGWARREIGMRVEEKDLPKWLLDNKDKYAKYFK